MCRCANQQIHYHLKCDSSQGCSVQVASSVRSNDSTAHRHSAACTCIKCSSLFIFTSGFT